jgi:hypothetical protein
MDSDQLLLSFALAIIIGYFVWRVARHAGFVGNLVGRRVIRTVGEVPTVSDHGAALILRVHILERELGQPPLVAISMVTKAFLGVGGRAMKLTAEDAKALGVLLSDASRA